MKLTVGPEVRNIDLTAWYRYAPTPFFLGEAGTEPYRLLAYLAQQLPPGAKVADLGTFQGASAVALASNPSANITTYDISSTAPNGLFGMPNINIVLGNVFDRVDEFWNADLIHLDLDPHDGIQEMKIFACLADCGFQGLLICDDIRLNPGMDFFWSSIELKKLDLTRYGHWSGTGVVVFDPETIDVEVAE